MTKTIQAVFDGEALRPTSPVDLEPNTSYRISIELPAEKAAEAPGAWAELEALAGSVEAPEDWAREHDHYLYGSPKRSE
ncbi:MAG: antitoxin family protein [bacterium]|nr:antitoxin family protein [bacterium]